MSGEVREAVRERYAKFALELTQSSCCGESACCSTAEANRERCRVWDGILG